MPSRLSHTCQDARCRMGNATAPRLEPSRHFNRLPRAIALIAVALGACADAHDTPGGAAGSPGTDDGGTDPTRDGGADPTRDGATKSDAPPATISEDEWKQKTSIYRGEHDIEAFPSRGCPTLPIGREYGIVPPVSCAWRSGSNSIRDCNAEPTCRRHADCATPLDRCRGAPSASCGYPGATPTQCASDAECTAVPNGRCLAPPNPTSPIVIPPVAAKKSVALRVSLRGLRPTPTASSAPGGSCDKLISSRAAKSKRASPTGDCTSGKRCACSIGEPLRAGGLLRPTRVPDGAALPARTRLFPGRQGVPLLDPVGHVVRRPIVRAVLRSTARSRGRPLACCPLMSFVPLRRTLDSIIAMPVR